MEETQYRFESAALGEPLHVHGVHLVEGISEPYLGRLLVTTREADADLSSMLGENATLTVGRANVTRTVRGVVVALRELDTAGRPVLPETEVTIAPALHLLSLRRNTRMFQDKTVPEILEDVLSEALGAYGRSAELSLEETYAPREYCLQYQETDLAFVQRLMEEEGIHYTFDHEGDVEVMRLADRNAAFEAAVTANGALPYAPHDAGAGGESEGVFRFRLVGRHTTTAITVNDFDWTQGTMPLTEAADGADDRGRTRESYEHGRARTSRIGSYDEGARRYQQHDAARLAGVRHQEANRDRAQAHGVGRAVGLRAGTTFSLTGHPAPGADGRWLITRVEHLDRTVGSEDGRDPYQNRFVCVPADTPFRPRRLTPKPTIAGVQTAVVTGPAGEEIHVDEHGRIKVQLHWDRENPADETSSCWIRVKQEWAGAGWGFWWVPRIGQEVLVHFVDGDPDRPLVTGAYYDGTAPTPYSLPGEKTKSTIKSASSLGSNGFNEFRFEDAAGSEQIYTHAQKDYNEVVENDHTTLVHHDQTNTVDNDQTQTVHNNQTERVDVDQTMSVGGNRTVHVEGDYDETVDGTETRTVTGDVTETFDATEQRSIAASVTETIGANETRDIAADQSETIGASHSMTIGGNHALTVAGAHTQTVTGGITTLTPGAMTGMVGGTWRMTAEGGILFVAAAGVKIVAPGGVQRIDKKWDLKAAGYTGSNSAFTFETYALKTSLTDVGVSVAIKRHSDVGVQKVVSAARTAVRNARVKQSGVTAETGGLAVEQGQEVKT